MNFVAISIIIPVYNVENYLPDCLNSLLNQTLNNIEIICIDDGSKDKSLEILKDFATKDNRIKVLTQQNQGPGAARNNGLAIASGEFIGFVDSDDFVEKDYFEKLYNTARKHQADIAIASILKHKKNKTKYNVHYKKEKTAHTIDGKFKLCEDKKQRVFYVWNKIYKTDLIKTNNILFPTGIIFEDVLFSTKAIYFAKKIVSAINTKYHYIERQGSIINTTNKNAKRKQDHDFVYNEMQKFAKENNFQLPERLNYTQKYWKGILKIYKGKYKTKYLLFGFIPVFIKVLSGVDENDQ